MSKRISLLIATAAALLAACTPKLPAEYKETGETAVIYPDYTDVTVPRNIAPLHFRIEAKADGYVTVMKARGEEIVKEGREVRPTEKEWRRLTEKGDIEVRVFTEKDGRWEAFKPFAIRVSPDAIDPWISYRLISPSYVAYENLTLQQRCLENYEERLIYGNMINPRKTASASTATSRRAATPRGCSSTCAKAWAAR